MSKYSLHVARVFVDAFAEHMEKLATVTKELVVVADAFTLPAARAFFDNPRLTKKERESVVLGTLEKSVSAETLALVRLLIGGGAYRELAEVARNVQALANRRLGLATATIETAGELDAATLAELTSELGRLTGKTVSVETKENPALLAGIKILVDGDVVDLSLAGRLEKLREIAA